jgi:hypothetical protein
VVREQVLETNRSRKLAAYAVWEPILVTDDARSSRKATTLLPDPRVRNYWTGSQDLGELFQPAIGLTTEPAWDVYLVYPRGVVWEGVEPPRPEYFMHQLAGRLPEAQMLDGRVLADRIRAFTK